MKIEKINQNTLKIILSIEELSIRNITIKDIENGKKKAQNFFFSIIEESAWADDFLKDDNKLLVEAAISKDDTFIITITKIDETPNLSTSSGIGTAYIFNTLEDLNKFVLQTKKLNLYIGTNNLYKQGNIFFLTFPNTVVKSLKFRKTYITLIEYCYKQISKSYALCKLKENSSLIICKNAIQTLSTHILE